MKTWVQWVAMMMVLFTSWSAKSDTIKVDLNVPEPALRQDADGFVHLEVPGYMNIGRPGEPELPVGFLQVLIPPGQRVDSLELLPAEAVDLKSNRVVYPKQKPWPLSWGNRPHTPPDQAIYGRSGAFPPSLLRPQPLQNFRGFKILPLLVYPVVYNPQTGRLVFFPTLTVVVHTSPDGTAASPSSRFYRGFRRDFDAVRRLVSNPHSLSAYRARTEPARDTNRYVIITSQQLAGCSGQYNLQFLADDKASRGLSPMIKTMEDILGEYSGADDAEKVRNFIADMYQNNGTDYVLLVGDADLQVVGGETQAPIVPVRGLCCYLDGMGTEENIPSDLYYAALDGNFNANGNSCWGEQDDGTDLLPEVWVGRVPADNCTEVGNFVHKTLDYQNAGGDWLRSVYMVGEWLWDSYPGYSFGIDFLIDVQNSSTTDGYNTKGFSESTFYQVTVMDDKFEDGPDCPGQSSPCWTAQEMLDVLNGGNHIINHLGHSYTDYNMRLYCDDISTGLTNTLPFFDYSQGCYPAAFDNRTDYYDGYAVLSQDSFVEYLLLGGRGAFAAVMNTRYGLGWSSNYFHRFFWDAAFRESMNQPGPMQAYSQEKMSPGVWADSGIQWVYYVANFFGDPEISIHGILPMQGPYLTYFDHEVTSDGSNQIPAGPGRQVVMPITLRNMGADAATAISAALSSNSPLVSITQANPVFANIAAAENGRSTTHAEFDISAQAQDGEQMDFSLDWTAGGGYSGNAIFSVRVERPILVYVAHTVDDSGAGCDADGIADAGEASTFSVSIENQGSSAASDVMVSLSASQCAISGPVSLGAIPAGGSASADFTVTAELSMACPAEDWSFAVSVQAQQLPQADSSGFVETLNADIVQDNFVDDMEGAPPNGWSHSAGIGSDDWGYVTTSFHSPSHAWFTTDPGTKSDKYLMMPQLAVDGTAWLTFWHRIDSEANYDGAVVEISVNGGGFQDLGNYMTQNGYNDSISSWTDSALAGRPAWAGSIAWQQVSVDLSSFGPADVIVRFRFASDSMVNASGWWIDDVSIDSQVPICQQQSCSQAPVADAGPDQVVPTGALVQLDGSQSYDPGSAGLQFSWNQTGGPAVNLSDLLVSRPTFSAPTVSGFAALDFELTVSNGTQNSSDSVTVTVINCDDGEECTTDVFTGSGCSHTGLADCTTCGPDGVCMNGICQAGGQNTEVICDDGDACTLKDICQAGSCLGTDPVVCQPLDQCHQAGICNPANGACTNPEEPDGSVCDDGNACTGTDGCQAGVCTGSDPVVCQPLDQCHDAGVCDPANGACTNPEKPDGGACDDGDACTAADVCQAGVCTGTNPVSCQAADECHGAECNPVSGECEFPPLQDGSACDDGDACTGTDGCLAGVCTGGDPVVCQPLDQCHSAGMCDPESGTCSNPEKASGSACDDGDACTAADVCQAGICLGANPVVCQPQDQCHQPGECDPQSGTCSNPEKPDGSTCDDGDACTQVDSCQAGECTGTSPVSCQAQDECHAAECDPLSGQCSYPELADGTSCSEGTCRGGVCTSEPSSGCGCSAAGNRSGIGLVVMLLGIAMAISRRRRPSGRSDIRRVVGKPGDSGLESRLLLDGHVQGEAAAATVSIGNDDVAIVRRYIVGELFDPSAHGVVGADNAASCRICTIGYHVERAVGSGSRIRRLRHGDGLSCHQVDRIE